MIATVVDWNALGDVVVASLVAGIAVSITFSLLIVGVARSDEMRHRGRSAAATAYLLLAAASLTTFLGGIALAIVLITSKG
jgi:Na+/H+-dicarboxylate symporter